MDLTADREATGGARRLSLLLLMLFFSPYSSASDFSIAQEAEEDEDAIGFSGAGADHDEDTRGKSGRGGQSL